MLDFIFVPAIFAIVSLAIYKIFELFVGRKERLLMIEKWGNAPEGAVIQGINYFPLKSEKSYMALKFAFLMLGLGLGLMVGFFISSFFQSQFSLNDRMAFQIRETVGIIYGASVLLFGGLGLLLAFFIEMKYSRNKSEQ